MDFNFFELFGFSVDVKANTSWFFNVSGLFLAGS